MPRLYRAVNAFVLPTRGEGWGLPLMEAMAMGLPTISTNYGGQVAFMNPQNSFLVNYTLEDVPASFDRFHALPDTPMQWAKPDIGHLRAVMRQVRSNPAEARARGAVARQHIVDNFGIDSVADIIVERLKDIRRRLDRP